MLKILRGSYFQLKLYFCQKNNVKNQFKKWLITKLHINFLI